MAGQDGKFGHIQTNELSSLEVSDIIVDNILQYDAPKVFTNDRDIPDKQYVDEASGTSDIRILIEAGSNPTTLVNGVDFVSPNIIPLVLQVSNPTYPTVDDTKLTTEGQSLRVDYQYSDNTLSVLTSIDVYVADDTVDTWVRII